MAEVEGEPSASRKRKADAGEGTASSPRSKPRQAPGGGGAAAADEAPAGPRSRLAHFSTVEDVVGALRRAKRIMVLAGAGMSVASGIPDFRSRNGIYDLVQKMGLELPDPQCLFDLEYFQDDPEPFYQFAHRLYPEGVRPTLTHRFLAALARARKLQRVFTQNIDGLELAAGLPPDKVVACHGSLSKASCLGCKRQFEAAEILADVAAQRVALCPKCGGTVKPNVTFFGEKIEPRVKRALAADRTKVDLLVVIGTALKVKPMSSVVQFLPPTVPQVLVNLETVCPPPTLSEGFDVELLGQCDHVSTYLAQQLGWHDWDVPLPTAPLSDPSAAATDGQDAGADHAGAGAERSSNGAVGTEDTAAVRAERIRDRCWRVVPPLGPSGAASADQGQDHSASVGGVVADPDELEAGLGPEPDVAEVISCDLCQATIIDHNQAWACVECFDYDLCQACHARGKNPHTKETGHKFRQVAS